MSLIAKTSPVGIDVIINDIQALIYSNLWTSNTYESYHRAYKNETDDGSQMFEAFTSSNEYKEVLSNDGFEVSSFFIVDDNASKDLTGYWSTTISIIFQMKLTALYPLIAHRADEEAHNDVATLLQDRVDFEITGITKGIRGVYNDIGYGSGKFDDMQPYHVFKVDILSHYNQYC